MRIDIPVFEGLDELDALGPLEVLRNAESAGADLSVRLVTLADVATVTGSHGVTFVPDDRYRPGEADVVVVPGGNWASRSEVGAWGEVQRGDLLAPLAAAGGDGALMAGVCTGTLLLAHAGVVGDHRATTHHAAWKDLAATGAHVVPARLVDDGPLVTSGGVTAGIDLALWLVERLASPDLAALVAELMEYEPARPLRAGDELPGSGGG